MAPAPHVYRAPHYFPPKSFSWINFFSFFFYHKHIILLCIAYYPTIRIFRDRPISRIIDDVHRTHLLLKAKREVKKKNKKKRVHLYLYLERLLK